VAARKSYAGRAAATDGDGPHLTVGGVVSIAIDTVLNAGGMWAVVLNLNGTDSYQMFAKSLDFGGGQMRMLPALGIALALGFILAIAPHKLWKSAEGAGQAQHTRRRLASLVAAAGGWYTTWLFVQAVAVGGVAGLVVSLLVEWLLFEFKREVLR
jgi:hypothetical protein